MTDPDWRVYSTDTVTGEVLDELTVTAFPFERLLSAGGTMSGVTVVRDPKTHSKAAFADLTDWWSRTLVLECDGVLVGGGAVKTRKHALGSWTLGVDLVDVWGLLGQRFAIDHGHPNSEKWSITYKSMTLNTLLKRAVQRGTDGPPLPAMSLPITFEADKAGALERSYYGYHYETVLDVIDDLMAEGADVSLEPRWLNGRVNWQMRTTFPPQYREWAAVPGLPGATKVEFLWDGSRMANQGIVIGEGSEQDMLVRSERNYSSPRPFKHRVERRKGLTRPAEAAAAAAQILKRYAAPNEAISFSAPVVGVNGQPDLTDLRVGDTAIIHIQDDPILPDTTYERQITKISGGMQGTVDLECQLLWSE